MTISSMNPPPPYEWTPERRRELMRELAGEPLMDRLTQIWLGQVPPTEEEADVPALAQETATRMQTRVMAEIRRGDLSGEVLRMATTGFSNVAIALLRPLLTLKPQSSAE